MLVLYPQTERLPEEQIDQALENWLLTAIFSTLCCSSQMPLCPTADLWMAQLMAIESMPKSTGLLLLRGDRRWIHSASLTRCKTKPLSVRTLFIHTVACGHAVKLLEGFERYVGT